MIYYSKNVFYNKGSFLFINIPLAWRLLAFAGCLHCSEGHCGTCGRAVNIIYLNGVETRVLRFLFGTRCWGRCRAGYEGAVVAYRNVRCGR